MNRPMPLNPAHPPKRPRPDRHPEVTLTTFLVTCMSAVPLAFIFYFKNMRLERRFELLSHLIRNTHFSHLASSSFGAKR